MRHLFLACTLLAWSRIDVIIAQPDTLNLDNTLDVAEALLDSSDFQAAFEQSSTAVESSVDLPRKWYILKGRAHHLHARILEKLGRDSEALEHGRYAINFLRRNSDDAELLAEVCMLQANLFSTLSSIDSLSYYYTLASQYASVLSDSTGIHLLATIHTNAGGAYIRHQLLDSVQWHLVKAQAHYSALSDTPLLHHM